MAPATNQALHRTPYAVVLFAKKRKKARQHTPPVNAALLALIGIVVVKVLINGLAHCSYRRMN